MHTPRLLQADLTDLYGSWLFQAPRQSPDFTANPSLLTRDLPKLFISRCRYLLAGLSPEEEEDLMAHIQERLIAKSWSPGSQWDPAKGRNTISGWIILCSTTIAINWRRRRQCRLGIVPISSMVPADGDVTTEGVWDALQADPDPLHCDPVGGHGEQAVGALLDRLADLLEHELSIQGRKIPNTTNVRAIVHMMRHRDPRIMSVVAEGMNPGHAVAPKGLNGWATVKMLLQEHREELWGV